MEYKKSKWETEYDKFKAENEELKKKMATIRREQAELKEGPEYAAKKAELAEVKKTLARYKRIEENSTKIENVLKFKKQLVESTSDLLAKRERVETLEKGIAEYKEEMDKLDKDRAAKQELIEKISQALKKPNLKEEDREKLEAQREAQIEARGKNDDKYIKYLKIVNEADKQLATYDKAELDKQILRNEKLISKCDLIGANLVKGKSLDEITASLNNFEFTPSKEFSKKIKSMRELYGKDKKDPEAKKEDEGKSNDGEKATTEPETGAKTDSEEPPMPPKKVSFFDKFLQKHPRIAKFTEGLRNMFKKDNSEKETISEPETKPEEKVEEVVEETKLEDIMTEMDRMGEDAVLSAIAEKGTSDFIQSLKDEKAAKAAEKLAENRRAAESRDVEKYGSRYNDMSYKHIKPNEQEDKKEDGQDR